MNRLELSREAVKRLERKLSDAREAIISMPQPAKLSYDGLYVTVTKECYNKIIEAINI